MKTESLDEVRELRAETEDRFGKIPPELDFLFNVAVIKGAAFELGLRKMICSRWEIALMAEPDKPWEKLELPARWRKRIDGLIGPGGFGGIGELAQLIEGQFSAIC